MEALFISLFVIWEVVIGIVLSAVPFVRLLIPDLTIDSLK